MTDGQIEARLATLEQMIAREHDIRTLAVLNWCLQKLLDEQVNRDLKAKERI